jgi:multimeric flavodoxin WrbA
MEEKMSNKIVFIHGSPRKNGNTHAISRIAIQVARDNKADVFEIDATKLEFKIPGCGSCMKCHQSEEFECVVGDQLAESVATLSEYDVIVVATPTYWMSYTAQLKMFIDRMGSLMKFTESGETRTPLAGKVFAILATGGGGLDNNLDLLEQQWKSVAYMLSCQFNSCMFPNAPVEAGALTDDPSALQKAQEFGELLASV